MKDFERAPCARPAPPARSRSECPTAAPSCRRRTRTPWCRCCQTASRERPCACYGARACVCGEPGVAGEGAQNGAAARIEHLHDRLLPARHNQRAVMPERGSCAAARYQPVCTWCGAAPYATPLNRDMVFVTLLFTALYTFTCTSRRETAVRSQFPHPGGGGHRVVVRRDRAEGNAGDGAKLLCHHGILRAQFARATAESKGRPS